MLVELDVVGAGEVVVVVFVVSLVSLVFSVVGFTTVVLFSTFFSGAGEVPGATTVVSFCSQPPRSAALAKMQINFFIDLDWLPILDKAESKRAKFSALPKFNFRRRLPGGNQLARD